MMTRQLLADMVRSAYPSLAGVHAPLADTPIVVADDVAAWLDADTRHGGMAIEAAIRRFEGPLAMAPPMYDQFWVEAEFPAPVDRDSGYRVGVLVTTNPSTRGSDLLGVRTWGWVENVHGLQRMDVGGLEYYVDRSGEILAAAGVHDEASDTFAMECTVLLAPWSPRHLRGRRVFGKKDTDPGALLAVMMTEFAIATCAFAVCRNVRPEQVDVPPKVARKRARALGLDEPTLSYSRITLPGFREWRTRAKLAASVGPQALPISLVRAHPKTYRRGADGSGGLGRHHVEGTWLWSPQVRGSGEHGTRVPLVTVSPPAGDGGALP